jgi:transcriptional regulator with XRE-family HTH domain
VPEGSTLAVEAAGRQSQRVRQADDDALCLTPNQVVAYNLPRARRLRGWTQDEAAEALAPYVGTRWSVVTFSAIERSVVGHRIRQFSADDLLAISRGFDLPIGFFLIPPAGGVDRVRIATPDSKGEGTHPRLMIDALLGTDDNSSLLEDELATWEGGPARFQRLLQLRAKAAMRHEFGEVEAARHVLTRLLQVLEDTSASESSLSRPPLRKEPS